ncbi:protein phosphatase CheZ [Noviherbaspirillum autotrophicum]|uniref:Protein phosphatase CheZ n=1 Tax=Noviherbaspirillum autotrophicum TaxID=709839 RepID=A0A0C2BLN7_9BURK|nr:chemotaxis protein CheZ [Noviherbaspirillum autotrophicum]
MVHPRQQAAGDLTMPPAAAGTQEEVLARIGQMTRALHQNLRALGFDKLIEKAAHEMPTARDRLSYVAKMTEQAAQRVLNATDVATPLQEGMDAGAGQLAAAWQELLQSPDADERYRAMAAQTLDFLGQVRSDAGNTKQQLLTIMMAQDFQDLTGQVIKKVTELAHGLEQQLVQLLIDYAPPELRRDAGSGLLNGPQINPEGNPDVVAGQEQVDDLLDSLGF